MLHGSEGYALLRASAFSVVFVSRWVRIQPQRSVQIVPTLPPGPRAASSERYGRHEVAVSSDKPGPASIKPKHRDLPGAV